MDTDILVQMSAGRSLQDIVDKDGYKALRQIEESFLLGLSLNNHVIATGGSVVYSKSAMSHLKSDGLVFFLNVDLITLISRVTDFETRGLARRPDQSFKDLFYERYQLYTKYADIIIDCASMNQEEVCASIIKKMNGIR